MAVPMDPSSTAFMLADSRNTPMQVGALQLFTPPPDAGPDYVNDLVENMRRVDRIRPLFLKRPYRSLSTAGAWTWIEDEEFDIEHHVRHLALPRPGRIRELLEMVGRLHGNRLSFERPLWEFNVIEGLEDGRIATYAKVHHALVDGVAAMRLLQRVLTDDPAVRDLPPPWGLRAHTRGRTASGRTDQTRAARLEARLEELTDAPASAFRSAIALMSDAAGLPTALATTLRRSIKDEPSSLSLHAPRTFLNREITGARRFAAQDWEIERLKELARRTGTTLNDVVLAMCGGALRRYLHEHDGLPATPLVAMVPVSLRAKDVGVASASGGNAVGSIMVKLGTHLADPAERLNTIHHDMYAGKKALSEMTPLQVMAMAALGSAPAVITPMLRLQGILPPPYNVIVSNVPGPRKPLYMNGARLEGMYPVSVPLHGIALNITCMSYLDNLSFGFTGDRRSVPHLQRLLVHLDDELIALEKAAAA